MSTDHYEDKYTKPDLRRKIKDEIMESDKGGKPGQWSARKSQLLVQEYEKQGGDYKQNEKDEAAKSLDEWTEQNWQTQAGEANARQDGETKRYLPEAVWDRLSDKEKQEAEQKKAEASKRGEQHVEWTPAIQREMEALKRESEESSQQELYKQAQELDISGRSKMSKDELQKAIAQAEDHKLENQTRQDLYHRAQVLEIEGRSQMNKQELIEAIGKTQSE